MSAHKNLPKSVHIGPYRYKVVFDDKDARECGYLGVHVARSKELRFDSSQAETELPQTFIHEILHAMGMTYGIEAWNHHTVANSENGQVNTDQIDLMATVILMFLRDNPEIVKWIMKGT